MSGIAANLNFHKNPPMDRAKYARQALSKAAFGADNEWLAEAHEA